MPATYVLQVGDVELSLGVVVLLQQEDDSSSDNEDPAEGEEPAEAPLGLVQAMWQTPDGETTTCQGWPRASHVWVGMCTLCLLLLLLHHLLEGCVSSSPS